MRDSEINALYKNTIERFEEADRWVFQQDSRDYPAFLAARTRKIQPILDEARQVLARIAPFCQTERAEKAAAAQKAPAHASTPQTPAAESHGLDEKTDIAIAAEIHIADFLRDPRKIGEMKAVSEQLVYKGYYAAGYRIYRYLIWHRQTFPATPTPQENGITAVLRVKNESLHMRVMLPVLLSYFDEIVVVDHNSTDDTYDYVAALNHPKIRLFRYTVETARAGEFYESERGDGKGSLAAYYNFAFEQARTAYVCKWDADMYPLPALGPLLEQIRATPCDAVKINGLDCYGYVSCTPEARIFRNGRGFRYEDMPYFEYLKMTDEIFRVASVQEPVYLHMKRDALPAVKPATAG